MRSYTTSIKLLPSTLAAFALYSATATAQDSTLPATPPAVDNPDMVDDAPPVPAEENLTDPIPAAPAAPAANTPALPGETAEAVAPEEDVELVDGRRLNDANLNTVFEVLASDAGLSYFHNNRIAGEDFKVNGYLQDGDPITQMEDLAFSHALTLHRRGNTIYALTTDQLNQLPATEWTYQLRYLRSSNMKEHIRELVSPLLSPNTGIVNYEEKTNTLVIIDTPHKIERVKSLLERVDKAKGQIVVEVKVLRVNQTKAQNLGADWSEQLGGGETNTGVAANLAINNLLGVGGAAASVNGQDLVFSPSTLSPILRALNEGGVTKLLNNPVLITEDNEPANISVIERIPILEYSSTASSAVGGAEPTVELEVRYKIDEEDSTDPETTREIGTTIAVTPTLLPDGTIRLKMRPRTASVTDTVTARISDDISSEYPVVLESSLTTIARIPDGHSLVVGGFYQEDSMESKSKVPLLGDLPIVRFFFKNSQSAKEQASLIFIVTPSSYNPANHASHHRTHHRLHSKLELNTEKGTFDKPGNSDLHNSDLNRTLKNIGRKSGISAPKARANRNARPHAGSNQRYRVHR